MLMEHAIGARHPQAWKCMVISGFSPLSLIMCLSFSLFVGDLLEQGRCPRYITLKVFDCDKES